MTARIHKITILLMTLLLGAGAALQAAAADGACQGRCPCCRPAVAQTPHSPHPSGSGISNGCCSAGQAMPCDFQQRPGAEKAPAMGIQIHSTSRALPLPMVVTGFAPASASIPAAAACRDLRQQARSPDHVPVYLTNQCFLC